jgi:VCBS repeat-containing protein
VAGFSILQDPSTNNGTINWTYAVTESSIDFLAAGEKVTLLETITVNDGKRGVASQEVSITITGTNDAPTITTVAGITEVLGAITEDTGVVGTTLTDTGIITFDDLDFTDAHIVSIIKISGTLGGNLTFGSVSKNATTTAGSVPWTYTVDNGAAQYLAEDQTENEVFTVTFSDGRGGTVTQDVMIAVTGTNDAPILSGDLVQNVLGVEDETIDLTINNFAELIDHDLADQIYIEIVDILGGRLEQAVTGGQPKSISEGDSTAIKLKRDANGKIDLDGNLQFKPNPNLSGDAQVRYRLWDGRAFSAMGVIPIVLAAQADQIFVNSLYLTSSL